MLTCFEAVAAGEDWALAWAARPVAAAGALPPRHCWSALRLKSPPHMATVLAHLQAVRPTPSAAPPPPPPYIGLGIPQIESAAPVPA